ncbi:hypothetical protein H072_1584 [Dactylellina haptotyla CBS 200.50]|uniref:Endo-beta-1,6-galactanase-like domain-containing protein n=1 Tax=Dactylellina haptotyla (strain CBS 200.50) TaxID=1284197 RepID=S8ANH3_DACHA|nr:hypothetical protein H072_1584 [Dactylellina haptotyla CBS 200.50]
MSLTTLLTTSLLVSATLADQTFTINPSTNWGKWQGWGTSLAWWAKAFGTRTDLSQIFFSTNLITYNGQSVPGLGLNIVRYNAGACSTNTYGGTHMAVSPSIQPSRQIDGYWLDWGSTDPASSSWNWNVDSNQRTAMLNAKANGANRFLLFSNSPMWWMCLNKNPSGSADGSENIQSWNLQDHATYLATVAKHAQTSWGITFESVEAFNEPSANWWKANGSQEGCNFKVATQSAVIGYLRTALNNQGLSGMQIAASDENSYDVAKATWAGLTSTAKSQVNQIHVHGYQQGGGDRVGVYNYAQSGGKTLWNSEYGENDATGKSLVSNLILDFRWLHPTAWVYWQVIDGGGWGLIDGNNDAVTVGAVSQKYYALAQFTRHIREGMTIIDGGGDSVVAAYDSSKKKLVIVAVNWSTTGQYFNFDLSRFTSGVTNGATVLRWSTQLGTSGERYGSYASDTKISGTKFWSWFGSNVIQTFEVSGLSF